MPLATGLIEVSVLEDRNALSEDTNSELEKNEHKKVTRPQVCGWINASATKPVWAKMTPNITDITDPARCALAAGCEGVAAINTITSIMGVSMDSLRPEVLPYPRFQ